MEPIDIYLHEQAGKSNWINEIHNHHIYLPLRGTPFSGYFWFWCIMIVTSTYFPVPCFFSSSFSPVSAWIPIICAGDDEAAASIWHFGLKQIPDYQVGFLQKFKYQIIGAGARCRPGDQGYCHIQVDCKWELRKVVNFPLNLRNETSGRDSGLLYRAPV